MPFTTSADASSIDASFRAFALFHDEVASVLGADPHMDLGAVTTAQVWKATCAAAAKSFEDTSVEIAATINASGTLAQLAGYAEGTVFILHWRCYLQSLSSSSTATSAPAATATTLRNTLPEDTSHTSGGGIEASNEGDCAGRKRSLREEREIEKQQAKWARKDGAIVAPTRKGEGYSLPVGSWLTCKPDAAYNGIKVLNPSFAECHLAKLRRKTMPTLGNELEASWADLAAAFATLDLAYEIVEATHRFQNAKGGPFLNLLDAPAAVFLVALRVTVGGTLHKHCILVSTVRERHAPPFGKMVDNHGKMRPVYIEKSDRRGKKAAHAAFCKLLRQHPSIGDEEFTVTTADIYELRKI